jgi:glycopeptide antibiotics resistance protein
MAFFIALFLGIAVPWIVFTEKDKQAANHVYTIGRLAFVGWLAAVFFITVFASVFESMLLGYAAAAPGAAWLAFGYVASRRFADMGYSQWLGAACVICPFIYIWAFVAPTREPVVPPPLPRTR